MTRAMLALTIGATVWLLTGCSDQSTSKEALLASCDALASHPDDPGRFAAGVTDAAFAPGAAIEKCLLAVEKNPDEARAHFHLGRAYWLANRPSEALTQFVEAAERGYAPAMKYIGDAYLEGKGLPAGVEQDFQTALEWYEKSAAGGFLLAERAVEELKDYAAKNTFDASIFQNAEYMRRIYENRFSDVAEPILFIGYIQGITKMMDTEQMMDMDAKCKPLLSKIGMLNVSFQSLAAAIKAFDSQEAFASAALQYFLLDFPRDQGERDVVSLVGKYGCDSPITQTVVSNMMGQFN